ncbi:TBC1 domain family member 16 [Scaptodrosophila lebanonensis]|uniref:TBC1 domain family member 16 n=1 Tax=Drosophila lebanonensis TaxID=7225 RepID=A0A6J2U4V5_DROLE|nr:TBC1 domain family member 16 [Scaptodrosophila lebanonensis]
MPIGNIIKKASSLILGDEKSSEKIDMVYEDNEMLFCKNNVCLHPPTVARKESDIVHYPGYLTCTTKTFIDQYNRAKRPTLLLTWIPNSSLCKCSHSNMEIRVNSEHKSSEGSGQGIRGDDENTADMQDLKNELQPLLGGQTAAIDNLAALLKKNPITSVNITISNPQIENTNIPQSYNCIVVDPDRESSDNGCQGQLNSDGSASDDNNPNWMTPELLAFKHNLVFPDSANATPTVRRKAVMKCRRFSVDLSQMRSLRLFFNDDKCTSGQLVIASRESQYKILHFHYGGLDHLAQVLHQWHCFLHNITLAPGQEKQNLPYRHFMVCRPEVKKSEMHPDEGNVKKITTNFFYGTLLNEKGQIEDDLLLRKCVFFGGLEKSLRKTVWPFLLKSYSFSSTFEDRALLMDIKRQEYQEITSKRFYSMSPEEQVHFWKTVQSVVEKDVVRTDRSNPFFCGDQNPNTEIMKNILLNYAVYNYNSGISYTQGMSDLLAPVLCEVQNESETFWCFVGLMQRAFFVCTPSDIDQTLSYLRELIRIMLPAFFAHLQQHEAMELLFCHRWLLLCFKREFTEAVVIRMWEACWSNYLTDYFHLFLCLAIIAVYADDVIAQNLRTDEMLLHFSSLAMYMDGQLILRKARGMLHQYRLLPKIPCTLSGLCKRCGPGMWDSEHRPALQCVGHMDDEKCTLAMD